MTDPSFTRKRKQELMEQKPLSAWSDFVYSSPSSPGQDNSMNLDSFLQNNNNENNNEQLDSRRHSVAVGEMNFHSFDSIKQELDMGPWETDLQNLLGGGASIPSSWSSISSSSTMEGLQQQPALHRRAMSLRLETTQPFDMHHTSVSTASPTTPAFFTSSFLDALKTEDDTMGDLSFAFTTDTSNISASSPLGDGNDNTFQDLMMNHSNENTSIHSDMNTITPSAISNDVNTLTQWFLNQPLEEQVQLSKPTKASSPPTSPSNTSSMSPSPSPPITPMQPISTAVCDTMLFQQQHPSIPEEDEESEAKENWEAKTRKHNAINMRMKQGVKNAPTMKPLIQQYLLSSDPSSLGEHKVMILTSKVAQKSYGTEKRFLCPPPTTLLSGASWWTASQAADTNASFSSALAPPDLTVHISGEQTSQHGVLEWYTATGTHLDNASSHSLGDTTISGKCVSKQLHINDADEKRKRVEVQVKIQLGNGAYLGTLASKGIKVISKPSKKRQSVKNMELCIHHGTTISLFNRIRSQTVSTKYLGVSTNSTSTSSDSNGTCFVARTGSWDPFVIWIVDTSRSLDSAHTNRTQHPNNPNYPPPPAIALHTTPGQSPIALHYNQPVVLQCISTGLVSPVMVIRKVDKGSMVLGGNRVDDLSGATGGECGDESIGDPVSQLHKVAFQIVQDPSIAHNNKANYRPDYYQPLPTTEWTLPQSSQPVTYLACLNDVVGMHKTTVARNFVSPRPAPPSQNMMESSTLFSSSWSENLLNDDFGSDLLSSIVSQQEDGKVTRKRRVSCDVNKPVSLPAKFQNSISSKNRRRVNSLNDSLPLKLEGAGRRRSSTSSDRRQSISSDTSSHQANGACWTEDVSDASVWTIVGTDCASYTFWTPLSPFTAENPITPFPVLTQIQNDANTLTLTGENLARDLTVWFGDVKSVRTDYKCRESVSCLIPEHDALTESPTVQVHGPQHKIPILLVRGDGVVYNTEFYYIF